jgi:predicted enzyme related to lactoylglutathione lyase
MTYTMLKKKGKNIGALYKLGPQQKGVPPHWDTYASVASADESANTGLFGWGTKVGGDYTEWLRGGTSIGGMMKIQKEWGPVPPNWLVYFCVDDCDAAAKKAGELGGEAIVPPSDIPKTGRFSVLRDPQGAVFAVVKLTGG